MNIKLSSKATFKLHKLSQLLKINESSTAEKAIEALEREMQLEQEMNIWDHISDKTFIDFENNLS